MIRTDLTPAPARTIRYATTVLIAGLVLGVGTQILQGVLPDSWGVLANSGVVWAIGAFALGAILPDLRSAAIGGAIELIISSCIFYVAVDWFEGSSSNPRSAVIWACAGIVAGSVFGAAGHLARRSAVWRDPAWAFVAGAIAAEGVYLTWQVGNTTLRPAGVAELGIGAALLTVCMIRTGRKALTAAVFTTAGLLTLASDHLLNVIFMRA
jgi:Family of unknown function (DUF6518)